MLLDHEGPAALGSILSRLGDAAVVDTRVLLERTGRKPGQLVGKTPWLTSVHVVAPDAKIGDMIDVHIDSAGPNSLQGSRIERKAA